MTNTCSGMLHVIGLCHDQFVALQQVYIQAYILLAMKGAKGDVCESFFGLWNVASHLRAQDLKCLIVVVVQGCKKAHWAEGWPTHTQEDGIRGISCWHDLEDLGVSRRVTRFQNASSRFSIL